MTATIEQPSSPPPDQPVPPAAKKRHTARWAAIAVGVVMVVLVVIFATREPAANQVGASPLIGKLSPEITASDLDGQVVRTSRYQGRYVLVNFFASWCVPCREEHPELINFMARHAKSGDAQVVQVVFNDDIEAAKTWLAKNGTDWPVLQDPRGKIALDFGVGKPPESFLIAPNGLVLTRIVGPVTADGLDDLLAQAEKLQS